MVDRNVSLIQKLEAATEYAGLDPVIPLHKALQIIRQHEAQVVKDSLTTADNARSEVLDNEDELAILSKTLVSVIADHMHDSKEPLRTKLCRHLRPYLKRESVSLEACGEALRASSWKPEYPCDRLCESKPCQCAQDYARVVLDTAGVKYKIEAGDNNA